MNVFSSSPASNKYQRTTSFCGANILGSEERGPNHPKPVIFDGETIGFGVPQSFGNHKSEIYLTIL
jgi:hypothetical protein